MNGLHFPIQCNKFQNFPIQISIDLNHIPKMKCFSSNVCILLWMLQYFELAFRFVKFFISNTDHSHISQLQTSQSWLTAYSAMQKICYFSRVLVKCCTQEILRAHKLLKIRGNIAVNVARIREEELPNTAKICSRVLDWHNFKQKWHEVTWLCLCSCQLGPAARVPAAPALATSRICSSTPVLTDQPSKQKKSWFWRTV